MRTIIAGSRTCHDLKELIIAIESCGWKITTILSGMAKGADQLGILYGLEHDIPIERYPANWQLYGKSAGYRRNVQMANNAEALLALWDGESRGTKNMIDTAKYKNLKFYVHFINKE
jgi:hypothetical protein